MEEYTSDCKGDESLDEVRETIQDFVIEHFGFLGPHVVILIISILPVMEVRGGIPAGALLEVSFISTMLISLAGNIAPVLPMLLLFQPMSRLLRKIKLYNKFYYWIYDRVMQKGTKVKKYGGYGLVLFTAVPVPSTGAYSACLAAIIFAVPVRTAFLGISVGVVIAGLIVGVVSYPLF
ncbi:MAG: ligand-binding protein SH3 [Alkalicoccus sp.]|nr:MAG: ligand-binding protein SH3 [Alkalicoccus sp.]